MAGQLCAHAGMQVMLAMGEMPLPDRAGFGQRCGGRLLCSLLTCVLAEAGKEAVLLLLVLLAANGTCAPCLSGGPLC